MGLISQETKLCGLTYLPGDNVNIYSHTTVNDGWHTVVHAYASVTLTAQQRLRPVNINSNKTTTPKICSLFDVGFTKMSHLYDSANSGRDYAT